MLVLAAFELAVSPLVLLVVLVGMVAILLLLASLALLLVWVVALEVRLRPRSSGSILIVPRMGLSQSSPLPASQL